MKQGWIEDKYGNRFHYMDGQLHRTDGPAYIGTNDTQYWYLEGKLHRTDGPAIIRVSGTQEWYLDGKRHRTDGPAVIRTNGTKEWWVDGKELTEAEFNERQVNNHLWTVKDGLEICKELETQMALNGIHVALGGSLMYKGSSDKDCDVILYPHDADVNINVLETIEKLQELGFGPYNGKPFYGKCNVYVSQKNNKRIDFLFMNRAI